MGKKLRKEERLLRQQQKEIARLQRTVESFSRRNKEYSIPDRDGNTIIMGVVSDTHIGSLYERTDALREFYKLLEREDIPIVLHCGDMLDGHNMYRGQEFETYAHGLEQQLNALEERYPRSDKVQTFFITGNHDDSFRKECGVNVGHEIARVRPDLQYLDHEIATVKMKTSGGQVVKYQMIHPAGGTAYAVSYKAQKIIESMTGGQKPHAVFIGHFHKADYMPAFRNVQSIQAGCFQGLTPFMAKKPTPAHLGAWIVEDTPGGRLAGRFKAEFVSFFEDGK